MRATSMKAFALLLLLLFQPILAQATEVDFFIATKASVALTQAMAENGEQWQGINAIGSTNQTGVYGTQGVASATTTPGGRDSASSWIDKKGNLWLFGGENCWSNCKGSLNDLWKFDTTTFQWTWVSGANTFNSPGSDTVPRARFGASSWIDADDNLWLFSGMGQANDLWKFNTNASQWTRINGSTPISYGTQGVSSNTNMPGGKEFGVSWIDASGLVWLFGGFGSTSSSGGWSTGYLNDLWKFDPATSQWVWVSGSNKADPIGSYGTQGVANSDNAPGGRFAAASWIDSKGNLWLFGGIGHATNSTELANLNDLWTFNPKTNQWTWISGANTVDQKSSYGTQGVPSSTNVPGARSYIGTWTDSSDNLWLTDGNEVWRFDTKTSQWTWVSGTAVTDQQNDHIVPNSPGSRTRLNVWFDQYSRVWLFGGESSYGELGDLWMHESF